MKVLIFGAGGIGSVIGGFLARMGHEVSLLGRAPHLDAIRKSGLFITGIWGDYRIKAFDLYTSAGELRQKKVPFDLIFITVKSFDTRRAAEELAPLMAEGTTLVSFQNGLGNVEAITEKISPDRYLPGRVIFGVETRPGIAKVTVTADATVVGALPGARPKSDPVIVAHLLEQAKVPARSVPDILTHIWLKAVYNCALNGICSVWEMPYGDILKRDQTRFVMEGIVRECYAVAAKKGVRLDPPDAEAYLKLLTGTLIPRTAAHYPSMLQDLKKGKKLEIDALNGAICRLGAETGTPTPENEKIFGAVKHKESLLASKSRNA